MANLGGFGVEGDYWCSVGLAVRSLIYLRKVTGNTTGVLQGVGEHNFYLATLFYFEKG